MVKVGLIVLGIIFLIITFIALEVAITPEQKSEIKTVNSLCTAEFNLFSINVPAGAIGQKVLGQEEKCQQAHYMMLLYNYGWIGYALGVLFLILGIVIPGRHKQRIDETYSHSQESYSHHEEKHSSKSRFCGNCGSKLGGHEKHCYNCGKKV